MTWHRIFFWILLVMLPTQLGYHVWPQWAMVLGRRVDYLSPTVFVTDLLVLCTVGSYIIFNFQFSIFNKFSKLFLVFLLFVSLNIFFAADKPVAMYKWSKVVEFAMLGWYIVRTRPTLPSIVTPLSIGVLYSSVLAIAQFFLQRSVGGLLWWLGERTFTIDTPGMSRIALNWSLGFGHWDFGLKLRPYATFPHPNVLGGYIAAVLPLIIIQLSNYPIIQLSTGLTHSLSFWSEGIARAIESHITQKDAIASLQHDECCVSPVSNKKKIYYFVTFLLGAIALFLTFSRSAIVVGALAIAVTTARSMNHELRIMRKNFFVFILIAVFAFFLTSYFILHTSYDESVVVRQQLNAAAIKLWQTTPLFGVGLGNFLVRLPEALPTRTIYFLQPVHNIYLLKLSEIGIVGVGLIVFYVATFLNHESGIMKYGKDKTKFIIHTSLFIILLLGLVDHYPLTLQQGQLLLTILIAMSYN